MNRIVAFLGFAIALLGGFAWIYFDMVASGEPGTWGEIVLFGEYNALSVVGLVVAIIGVIVLVFGLALPNQKKKVNESRKSP